MVVGTVRDGSYPFYRCPPTADCDGSRPRPTISAAIVERAVWDEAVRMTQEVRESVAAGSGEYDAAVEAESRAQTNYEAAVGALADFTDAAAVRRLRDLRGEWEAAREARERAGSVAATTVEVAAGDGEWTQEGRRALLVALFERVEVSRGGRGAERLKFVPWA
jgi:hypothetical protein